VREALGHLRRDAVIYGFGQALGRGVQFLLVPIFTRALLPEVYGVADLVLAYSQFVVLVLVFGMDGALVRFFYQEPDRDARRRMVSTSLAWRIGSGVLFSLLFVVLSRSMAGSLIGSEVYRKYVTIGALTLPFSLLVLFSNDVLRVTFQPWKFIALNTLQAVVTAALSWWLVVPRDIGVAGVLYGKLGGDAVAALAGLALIRLNLTPRLSLRALARMLAFGWPLVPTAFAYGVISAADRFFLQRTRSLEEVGVYAVAVKFFSAAMLGVSAFSLAFFPFAHARAREPEAPRLYARVLALYVSLGSLAAMLVGLFAPEALAVLVPPGYREAARPALVLGFAAVAYGAYYVACLGVQLALKTPHLIWTALAGAVVAIGANVVATPRYGVMGAAVATLAGNVALAVLTYAVSQRVYRLPYRGARLVALYAVAVILAWLGQTLAPEGATGAAIKLGLGLLFAVLCVAVGIWTEWGSVGSPVGEGGPPGPPASRAMGGPSD